MHAPSRVVADGQTRDLIYEDNGNLVIGYDFSRKDQLPERRLTYNAENMPLAIEYQPQGGSTATTQITYDGDGRRVKKQTGADSVIYVDETYEIRNGQPVKYVFAGDQRVARIRGSEVHYFHKDHLGSSTLVTDAAGGLLESTTYEPYGLQRPDCDPKLGNIPYTFTDQEWDSETGLYNYDARLYDPVLGRFLTADSIVQNWHDPQALNRYAYARNNPLKYVDPDGHWYINRYAIDHMDGTYSTAYVMSFQDVHEHAQRGAITALAPFGDNIAKGIDMLVYGKSLVYDSTWDDGLELGAAGYMIEGLDLISKIKKFHTAFEISIKAAKGLMTAKSAYDDYSAYHKDALLKEFFQAGNFNPLSDVTDQTPEIAIGIAKWYESGIKMYVDHGAGKEGVSKKEYMNSLRQTFVNNRKEILNKIRSDAEMKKKN